MATFIFHLGVDVSSRIIILIASISSECMFVGVGAWLRARRILPRTSGSSRGASSLGRVDGGYEERYEEMRR